MDLVGLFICFLAGTGPAAEGDVSTGPYLVVLGMAQDGGVPHAGVKEHPGWDDLKYRRYAVCLGLVDPASSKRWMIEATPDFRVQLHRLDVIHPMEGKPGLDGIFLTHAHIGHYAGLLFLGRESMGTRRVPVFCLPRMKDFLSKNGPWDQLVRLENIVLEPLTPDQPLTLTEAVSITPFLVPHRQEYSEVAGFLIQGSLRKVLFIPDIDRWDDWDRQGTRIEELIPKVDVAYLDGTFFDGAELPGRDLSAIPHPFIQTTVKRLELLSEEDRSKVRFIHLNHTNPALYPEIPARKAVLDKGFRVTEEMEKIVL